MSRTLRPVSNYIQSLRFRILLLTQAFLLFLASIPLHHFPSQASEEAGTSSSSRQAGEQTRTQAGKQGSTSYILTLALHDKSLPRSVQTDTLVRSSSTASLPPLILILIVISSSCLIVMFATSSHDLLFPSDKNSERLVFDTNHSRSAAAVVG